VFVRRCTVFVKTVFFEELLIFKSNQIKSNLLKEEGPSWSLTLP